MRLSADTDRFWCSLRLDVSCEPRQHEFVDSVQDYTEGRFRQRHDPLDLDSKKFQRRGAPQGDRATHQDDPAPIPNLGTPMVKLDQRSAWITLTSR